MLVNLALPLGPWSDFAIMPASYDLLTSEATKMILEYFPKFIVFFIIRNEYIHIY